MKVKVTQWCLTLCNPMDCTVRGIPQAGILEWVAFPFSRESSQPKSPALQADSLPAEPQGKPKNTRVGSLSLLQGIFATQGSNPCLPHCRRILYQLSHQGIPRILEWVAYPFSSGSSQLRDQTRVFLHCRRIPHQLSYEGSPDWINKMCYIQTQILFSLKKKKGRKS